MPLGEIAGEALGGILRIVGQFLLEIVFELLIKGPGHAFARVFKPNADPDGVLSVCLGLAVWAAIGALVYGIYRAM